MTLIYGLSGVLVGLIYGSVISITILSFKSNAKGWLIGLVIGAVLPDCCGFLFLDNSVDRFINALIFSGIAAFSGGIIGMLIGSGLLLCFNELFSKPQL